MRLVRVKNARLAIFIVKAAVGSTGVVVALSALEDLATTVVMAIIAMAAVAASDIVPEADLDPKAARFGLSNTVLIVEQKP